MITEKNRSQEHDISQKAAIISILAATALGGNYTLISIPNIELSSVVVFLSGFLFGVSIGALVGLIAMTIYQLWNPWGFILPIGISVIGCTIIIGIVGGILGRNFRLNTKPDVKWFVWPGVFGVWTTLFFDLFTNYVYSLTFGVPFLVALVTGFPFLVIHIVSNGLLFGFLTPPILQAIQHFNLINQGQPKGVQPKTNNE